MLLNQLKQLENPDGRIVLSGATRGGRLRDYANMVEGLSSGDKARFIACFWEVDIGDLGKTWERFQGSPNSPEVYSGCNELLRWEAGRGVLATFEGARIQGQNAWGKPGVLISMMRGLDCCLYAGHHYDKITSVIVAREPTHLPALFAFASSEMLQSAARELDQALRASNDAVLGGSVDLDHWQKVADERYPDGLPEPHSDDPTQWLFRGDIPSSTNPLHVAMARLLGYRWPDQQDDGLDSLLDLDGIVTTTPLVNQESVVNRLRTLLKAAYESPAPERPKGAPQVEQPRVWDESTLPTLLAQAGFPGMSLEEWIKTKFFESHCKLFHHRPFIWHIWDGRKDGFHAFVNYHKLDNKNLERLTHVYLGEWIERQKSAVEHQEPTAEARLAAAQELQRKLELIRTGEAPYDIFVRWKTKAEQPIGWEPDLNDGVRMNIRPFVEAGILKAKVNVNWNKDRGKDPKPNVSGTVERHNDLHFTIEEKRIAKMRGQQ
jgi:hypothetical protein